MIRHIVCFGLAARDPAQRSADVDQLTERLESLVGRIPQLLALQVGRDQGIIDSHWDAVLVTDFKSTAELAAYQVHPNHVAVSESISSLIERRAVVDYEL